MQYHIAINYSAWDSMKYPLSSSSMRKKIQTTIFFTTLEMLGEGTNYSSLDRNNLRDV